MRSDVSKEYKNIYITRVAEALGQEADGRDLVVLNADLRLAFTGPQVCRSLSPTSATLYIFNDNAMFPAF